MTTEAPIRELLRETRSFPPDPATAATTNVPAETWERAAADPVAFWAEAARRLDWAEPWETTHSWQPARRPDGSLAPPVAEWFAGGRLNAAVNCVDRHVAAGLGDRVAFHVEGERGDRRTITYADLEREVARAAHALTELGIGKGDRVVVYLPVIPETIVATGAATLSAGAGDLSSGAANLASGSATLAENAHALSQGVASLAEGAANADSGAAKLADGAASLDEGAQRLAGGAAELHDGATGMTFGTLLPWMLVVAALLAVLAAAWVVHRVRSRNA